MLGSGSSLGIAVWLRAGRSVDRIPVGARFSAPVHAGPGAHPASCKMCTGSFPGAESSRGVTLTPHPLLVPRSKTRVALYLYSPKGLSWPVKRVKPTYLVLCYRCDNRLTVLACIVLYCIVLYRTKTLIGNAYIF
jgi:hypothetical protein